MSKGELIDYILNNSSGYSSRELKQFSLNELILVKVRVELDLRKRDEGKKKK